MPYPYYVKEELVQSAPLAAQIDRGAMVREEEKKKKSGMRRWVVSRRGV